jgi:peptidylprolyl isomerase
MERPAAGDTVRVHYTGRLEDGTVFDTSEGREPIAFTLGAGDVIPGFDEAVAGMAPGDTKTVCVDAEEAYGERRPDLVIEVLKADLPEGITPEVGMALELRGPNGEGLPVRVTAIDDDSITLDGNHPLAGEPLTFDVTVVDFTSPR